MSSFLWCSLRRAAERRSANCSRRKRFPRRLAARIPLGSRVAILFKTAERHVAREHGEQLYRIFVYDCKPLDKKAHHPITGKAIDVSRTSLFTFRNDLHHELVCMRKVALRLGELADDSRWVIRPESLTRLL